jgi:hypothetical protein
MSRQIVTKTQLQKPVATHEVSGLLQRKCACGNHTMVGDECEECSKKKRLNLQTKLKINEPGDIYEQEAERIADQVMAVPAYHSASGALSRIQPYSGPSDGQMQAVPANVDQALASPGRPLEPALRQDMEERFSCDFSHVRVHTDTKAEESAQAVNALAYTVGRDVVFGAGQYALRRSEGQHLIAHELAHVVQQSRSSLGIQRQEAPSKPFRSPGPSKKKPTGELGHLVDVVLQKGANRWLVTIDGIPVAEIAVNSKETPLKVQVDIAGSTATVTIRHNGDAALAPVADPGASLGLSVSLREIDMRQGASGRAGLREPPVPGGTAAGLIQITIAPPRAIRWPDEPVGELGITTPLAPGSLSEFEEKVRNNPSLINGIVLDPDNPGEVIGYRVFATAGLTRLIDREGETVFQDEVGIETPPVDPLDFIPTPGSVGKVGAGIVGRVGIKALGKKAAVKGTKVPLGVIARMRGVSKALFGRAARKGVAETPGFVRRITKAGLDHSFDRHAAQWFGRTVSRETQYAAWRELVERVAASKQTFPWSVGAARTIGHLGKVEGKYFVVQFFEETGELATAFIPNASQLREMLKLLKGAP